MDQDKIKEILMNYTWMSQTIKTIEELAELQKELAKFGNGKGDHEALVSEIADVRIMIEQVMIIYDIDPAELESEITYKLDRQMKRIRKELE